MSFFPRGVAGTVVDARDPAANVNPSIRDTIERVLILVASRRVFHDDDAVAAEVLKLVRQLGNDVEDADVLKIRSFAASAGDTIGATEALSVIKEIARRRCARPNA